MSGLTADSTSSRTHSMSSCSSGFNRRTFLGLLATATCSGATLLSACGSSGNTPSTVNVTISSADWPFTAMPDAATQAKDPTAKAYAESLKKWLDKNPGVTVKKSTANIWDQKALTTAISAGTVAAYYPAGVLGNWTQQGTRAAFKQGLAADVTPLLEKYTIQQKVADYARPFWQVNALDNKYYCWPADFDSAGHVVTYRRDLVQKADLQEPGDDWTWDDLRTLAKGLTSGQRKGAAMQAWGLDWPMHDSQFLTMSVVPSPQASWHWHANYTASLTDWKQAVDIYRGMRYQDQSVLTDTTYGDAEVAKAFGNEHAAMTFNVIGLYTIGPNDPTSPASLAKRLGKPIEEVVGVVRHPHGPNKAFGTTVPSVFIGSLDPHLVRTPATIDKAFSLYEYMTFGQGYIDQKVATYQAYKDLQMVFTNVVPLNGIVQFPGVPGTPVEAWGQKFVDTVHRLTAIPLQPDPGFYFPAESNTGPTQSAWSDASSALSNSQRDASTIITHAQQILNQQEASYTSSISGPDFTKAAQSYYRDLDAFWSKNAPDFYANDFHPWLQKYVMPVIGG